MVTPAIRELYISLSYAHDGLIVEGAHPCGPSGGKGSSPSPTSATSCPVRLEHVLLRTTSHFCLMIIRSSAPPCCSDESRQWLSHYGSQSLFLRNFWGIAPGFLDFVGGGRKINPGPASEAEGSIGGRAVIFLQGCACVPLGPQAIRHMHATKAITTMWLLKRIRDLQGGKEQLLGTITYTSNSSH